MHPAALPEDELLKDCRWQFQRRSGPGGQHRNKVQTAAILTHEPTGIVAEANEKRSQAENRKVALMRLRLALAVEYRNVAEEEPAGDSEPSTASATWQSRCRGGRVNVSSSHWDFPIVLAELLDCLHALEQELPKAAEHLRTTSSQLIKLLRQHPPAMKMVNETRAAQGYHQLK